jgi:hypothetical protein
MNNPLHVSKTGLFAACPALVPVLNQALVEAADATIIKFKRVATAQTPAVFFKALEVFNNVQVPSKELHRFVMGYMTPDNNCLDDSDKKQLQLVLEPFLHSKSYKEPGPILSINGRGVGSPYFKPHLTEEEGFAMVMLETLRKACMSTSADKILTNAINNIQVSARVRIYTYSVNLMLVEESRPAPVTRSTEHSHGTCLCDNFNKGIVRISGCAKCCVNMPPRISVCTCPPNFRVWPGFEETNLLCNHAGCFDPKLFAMMFSETGVCSICSEQTNGHCQHNVFAADVIKLHNLDVENHIDPGFLKKIIKSAEHEEWLYQRKKDRVNWPEEKKAELKAMRKTIKASFATSFTQEEEENKRRRLLGYGY